MKYFRSNVLFHFFFSVKEGCYLGTDSHMIAPHIIVWGMWLVYVCVKLRLSLYWGTCSMIWHIISMIVPIPMIVGLISFWTWAYRIQLVSVLFQFCMKLLSDTARRCGLLNIPTLSLFANIFQGASGEPAQWLELVGGGVRTNKLKLNSEQKENGGALGGS